MLRSAVLNHYGLSTMYVPRSLISTGAALVCLSRLDTVRALSSNDSRPAEFTPLALALGRAPSLETGNITSFTLDGENSIVTLDYGIERAGYPFFDMTSVSQAVQIEVKYSEAFIGLHEAFADGPFIFATSLANGFRVETYNVTEPGRIAAPLIQGGQRWQTIRLLTTGSVSFESAGFVATIDITEVAEMPGSFECSDETLSVIWKLGALAASTACVEQGTQGQIWEVDPYKGAFVRSVKPAMSITAASFSNYKLEFDILIDRAGVWWTMAMPFGAGGLSGGLQIMLIGDLSEESTFVNTNTSITPANSIVVGYGFGFVNQTTLPSYYIGAYPVPFNVSEKTWHHVMASLLPNATLSVSVNKEHVVNVDMSDYYTSGSFAGPFGFGGWQDQAAYVRNVTVMASNGSYIYTNPMTTPDILAEYGARSNLASVCLDGPKRDRLVWLGDFYHTARIIGVSTSQQEIARGTIQFLLDTQISSGELSITPGMGYDPSKSEPFTYFGTFGLQDYQLLGLDSLYSYLQQTNDLDFASSNWGSIQNWVNFFLSSVDRAGGLVNFLSAFLGPAEGGSAVSCMSVQALRKLAVVAQAINDTASQTSWDAVADALAIAINEQLWNDELGFYAVSTSNMTDFSVSGAAFCLTSGVANYTQTQRALAAVQSGLALGPGYRDSTQADISTAYISPNTNGFLLSTFTGNSTVGLDLIDSLWGAMVQNESTASGASWEYVSQDGGPGLALYTSLAHPWGGAATYILTERALGVRCADGLAGFGYQNWVLGPEAGIAEGLTWASGTVPTAFGSLTVRWEVNEGATSLHVNITAPLGTSGVFVYQDREMKLEGSAIYSFTAEGL